MGVVMHVEQLVQPPQLLAQSACAIVASTAPSTASTASLAAISCRLDGICQASARAGYQRREMAQRAECTRNVLDPNKRAAQKLAGRRSMQT